MAQRLASLIIRIWRPDLVIWHPMGEVTSENEGPGFEFVGPSDPHVQDSSTGRLFGDERTISGPLACQLTRCARCDRRLHHPSIDGEVEVREVPRQRIQQLGRRARESKLRYPLVRI